MVELGDVVVRALFWLFVAMVPFGCCIICCREIRREQELNAAVRPPSPVVKQKLGYFPYSAAVEGSGTAATGERPVCAICLEAFVQGATCSEVPECRHFFHQECIEQWMRSGSTCPLCRATIVPGSEPLSAAEDMV